MKTKSMKRLLYFAAILLAIVACSKSEDDVRNDNSTSSPDKPKDEITLSKSLISFIDDCIVFRFDICIPIFSYS